ncbi:beta strand repeat-containing protein [Chloroflexota bacterium]
MKKGKISRILGVALTLALLTSMLIGVAPASADVGQAIVTFPTAGDNQISFVNPNVVIRFTVEKSLTGAAGDDFSLTFPTDTIVPALGPTATAASSSGWVGGVWSPGGALGGAAVPANWTVVGQTMTYNLQGGEVVGEGAEIRVDITAGLTNPSASGSYTITVATSQETTAVVSAPYSIVVPILPPLPGIVTLVNPSGVPMAQGTGGTAIHDALNGIAPFTNMANNFTIQVGPGTYANAIVDGGLFTGVTIVPTGDASNTAIQGNVTIVSPGMTLQGFTINGMLTVSGGTTLTPVTISNNIISYDTAATPAIDNTGGVTNILDNVINIAGAVAPGNANLAIDNSGAGTATITGGTITMGAADTGVLASGAGAITKLDGCSITGGGTSGIGVSITAVNTNTISGNVIDGTRTGINIGAAATATITGNSIANGTATAVTPLVTDAAVVVGGAAPAPNGVNVSGNDIEDNAGYSVSVQGGVVADIQIIGNTFNSNTAGFVNNLAAGALDVTLNWWGNSSGPTITSNAGGTGDKLTNANTGTTNYSPFDSVGTSLILSSAAAATGIGTVDGSTTVGVTVVANVGVPIGQVTLAQYIGNPSTSATPYAALTSGYFDVFIPGAVGAAVVAADSIILRFYSSEITANTVAYYFSELTQSWTRCSTSAVAGNLAYLIVTINTASAPTFTDMGGTKFVLVNVPPAPVLTVTSPAAGVIGVSVKPTLVWSASPLAVSYQVQLAEDPSFATMAWSRSMNNNFYAIGMALEYSTTYYWRVRAQTSTAEDMVGPWVTGVFTTMAEPVEVAPPAAVETEPPVVNVEVAAPVVTVEPTPVTGGGAAAIPDYLLWTIVIIGAVLIIALIVLIVRTRRVA